MRIAPARVAASFLAFAASLMAAPAQAAAPAITLSLGQRWENVASLGAWAPYTATIRDDGTTDFTGDLVLVPNDSVQRGVTGTWPDYRSRVTVQKGTEKTFTIFVIQAPSNYRAEVRDLGGHTLATADISGGAQGGYTLAVLSDQHQAAARIPGYKPLASQFQVAISNFGSAAAFPVNAVYLNGLNALLIDDFDTASLSQAQIQTLKDFVGLGGSLVVAGGPSWRRTMVPLPPELSPLKPTASGTTALQPLAELQAGSTSQTAQVAVGEVHGQVLLGAAGAPPLAVGAHYGAGMVIDLAYDPLAEPFATIDPGLGTVAWSQALTRVLVGQSPSGRGFGPGSTATLQAGGTVYVNGGPKGVPVSSAAVAPGGGSSIAGQAQNGIDQVFGILMDTPVAAVPPIGLLGALLLAYVLLVAPLNYLLLRAFRRRELLWATVPAVSLLFTVSAYAIGFGSRGSDFVDNEVQIQRLGPDGALETQAYYGLYSPHKGDYTVRFPSNTLVSTALTVGPYGGLSGEPALIEMSGKPEVQIQGASIWTMRAAQSLGLSHQPVAIESHLRRSGSKLVGSITNRGPRDLGIVWAVSGTGDQAEIASSLASGQTIQVDQEMSRTNGITGSTGGGGRGPLTPTTVGGGGGDGTAGTPPGTGALTDSSKRASVMRIAATAAVSQDPYDMSLVSLAQPSAPIQVSGSRLTRYSVAALITSVSLESIDSLGGVSPPARLVSTAQVQVPAYVDVYDIAIPSGLKRQLNLAYGVSTAPPTPATAPAPPAASATPLPASKPVPAPNFGVTDVDVFDWSTGTWRTLPHPPGTGAPGNAQEPLRPGELQNGVVRVRAREFNVNLSAATLRLVEPAPPAGSGG